MQQVEYSSDNATKCWCGQCPVQRESACAKDNYQQVEPEIQQGQMPQPEMLPGLYCGTGKATCDDLKPKERCLCPECLVWGENDLHANHFCALGSADRVQH